MGKIGVEEWIWILLVNWIEWKVIRQYVEKMVTTIQVEGEIYWFKSSSTPIFPMDDIKMIRWYKDLLSPFMVLMMVQ